MLNFLVPVVTEILSIPMWHQQQCRFLYILLIVWQCQPQGFSRRYSTVKWALVWVHQQIWVLENCVSLCIIQLWGSYCHTGIDSLTMPVLSAHPRTGCLIRNSESALGGESCLKSLWGAMGNKLPSHILILAWTRSHSTCASQKVLPSRHTEVSRLSQKFSLEVEQ